MKKTQHTAHHTRTHSTQHTPHTRTAHTTHTYTTHHTPRPYTHITEHTRTHSTHTTHAHAQHTYTRMHTQDTMHAHAQHITYTHAWKHKKMRAKEGNLFKSSFSRAGVVVSAKHISSAPKGESSSAVELQIGGVVAPELVWWSRSPPKHALSPGSTNWTKGVL
jgi:hypothetical protein